MSALTIIILDILVSHANAQPGLESHLTFRLQQHPVANCSVRRRSCLSSPTTTCSSRHVPALSHRQSSPSPLPSLAPLPTRHHEILAPALYCKKPVGLVGWGKCSGMLIPIPTHHVKTGPLFAGSKAHWYPQEALA